MSVIRDAIKNMLEPYRWVQERESGIASDMKLWTSGKLRMRSEGNMRLCLQEKFAGADPEYPVDLVLRPRFTFFSTTTTVEAVLEEGELAPFRDAYQEEQGRRHPQCRKEVPARLFERTLHSILSPRVAASRSLVAPATPYSLRGTHFGVFSQQQCRIMAPSNHSRQPSESYIIEGSRRPRIWSYTVRILHVLATDSADLEQECSYELGIGILDNMLWGDPMRMIRIAAVFWIIQ
ncbi:hypothetical protein IW262DRAFT_1292491 [Armillaria fumosa]|nr:hypothetical protein IW262DRAFT_1292491 [Armillaria fumosa]